MIDQNRLSVQKKVMAIAKYILKMKLKNKYLFIIILLLYIPYTSAMTDDYLNTGWLWSRQMQVGNWGGDLCTPLSDETSCKQTINQTIEELKSMHVDAVTLGIQQSYYLAERWPDQLCRQNFYFPGLSKNYTTTCTAGKKFSDLDKRASWGFLNWTTKRLADENINAAIYIRPETVSSKVNGSLVVRSDQILGAIFGTQYNIKTKENQAINSLGNINIDFSYSDVRFMAINMFAWIANAHPYLKGIKYEEMGYWLSASTGCNTYGYCESWSPEIVQYVENTYGYTPTAANWTKTQQKHMQQGMANAYDLFYEGVRNNITRQYPDFYLHNEPQDLDLAYGGNAASQALSINITKHSENRWIDIVSSSFGGNGGGINKVSWCNLLRQNAGYVTNVLFTQLISIKQSGNINNYSIDQIDYARTCEENNIERIYVFEHRNLQTKPPGTITGTVYNYLIANPPLPPYAASTVSIPTFSPPGGNYSRAQSVTISTSTSGTTIRYTKDGTVPNENSPIYSSPVPISSSTTLKSRAWKTGLTPSAIASAIYQIGTLIREETYNLVNNSGFESGNTSWTFYTNGIGKFSTGTSAFSGNNSAVIDIYSNGSNMQLYQKGLLLEPNTSYRLNIAAYSTSGNDLAVKLFKDASPYTNYGLIQTFNLSKNWKIFTTQFNTTGFSSTINDGRLQFWLAPFAAAGDTYYIDDVRLEKIDVSNVSKYDFNKDGIVDIFDLLFISDRFNNKTKYPYPNYDTNTDGNIDILDIVSVTNKI